MAMVEVVFDVLEQILVRLDVKDIIRCMSVCKSWQSFVSSPGFVKAHLKHAYKNDQDCDNIGHRRIGINDIIGNDESSFLCNYMYIAGSCNGLVCISPRDVELEVINPWTRKSKKIQTPVFQPAERVWLIRQVVCLGFGYDASIDDYKVVVGFRNTISEELTHFYVLTLKNNIWKAIGEVKYKVSMKICGVLCDGALHWFMRAGSKKVIISLDLSTEEFKEIPEPVDVEFGCLDFFDQRLGVLEECLCIYSHFSSLSAKKWVMRNNKWQLYHNSNSNINNNNNENKYDIAYQLSVCVSEDETSYVYTHDDGRRVHSAGDHIGANLFVKSLVSPHDKPRQKMEDDAGQVNIRRRRRKKRKRTCKYIKSALV